MQPALIPILFAPRFTPASVLTGDDGFYFDITTQPASGNLASITSQPPSTLVATQGTASKRPTLVNNLGGATQASFDGTDDSLGTTLVPSTAGMVLATVARTTSVSAFYMGCQNAAGGRCFLGVDAVGNFAAGWGAQTTSTINSGVDVRNNVHVLMLRATATTVELWRLALATGLVTRDYTGAASGAPNTTLGIELGADNVDGTPSSFVAFRSWRFFAKQGTITDTQVTPILQAMARGIVNG